MFEHFDDGAHECVIRAQNEARRLGHAEIGTVHLLLGISDVANHLLGVETAAVRAAIVALEGSGPARMEGLVPFTTEAKAALDGANVAALKRGHTIIDPAHVLLAVLDAGGGAGRALREARAIPGEVRERANAAAGASPPPPEPRGRQDYVHALYAQALRDGRPVAVRLDERHPPVGDIGDPSVDAALLELILIRDTAAARLLRAHGIDEQCLDDAFGPADARGSGD